MATITIDDPRSIPALLELEMLLHLSYYYNFLTDKDNPQWDDRLGDFWSLRTARVEQLLKAEAVNEFNDCAFENWYDPRPALEFAAKHLEDGGDQ